MGKPRSYEEIRDGAMVLLRKLFADFKAHSIGGSVLVTEVRAFLKIRGLQVFTEPLLADLVKEGTIDVSWHGRDSYVHVFGGERKGAE